MNLDEFKFMDDFDTEDDDEDFVGALEKHMDKLADQQPNLKPDIVEEYGGYVDDLIRFYETQKGKRQELEFLCGSNVATKTYGRGGMSLHRGFYCPSPVIDLMIGGCNRGTAVQKLLKESGDYYIYYWNAKGDLLKVDKVCDSLHMDTEYLINRGNKKYGITFYASDEISEEPELLSMEEYTSDGKILKYITIIPDFTSQKKDHEIYTAEKYYYDDAGLLTRATFASGNLRLKSLTEEVSDIIYGNDETIIGFKQKGRFFPGFKRNR